MSDSIRDRLRVAVSAEPAVGDPYARFVHRRRLSRGFRTISGILLFGITLVGFVRVFPGTTGANPDDGFIQGPPSAPGFSPYDVVADPALGFRLAVPQEWDLFHDPGDSVRTGPVLALDTTHPEAVEIRIGNDLGTCPQEQCAALGELVGDRNAARDAGLRVTAGQLRLGAVNVDAWQIRYPQTGGGVAPWCPGCVGTYAELDGGRLPVLVLAPDRASLRASSSLLEKILATFVEM